MKSIERGLCCQIEQPSSHVCHAKIIVKRPFVQALYREALERHQTYVQARGFVRGATPLTYIERTYRTYIIEHMKEFLLNHCVINFLCQELNRQKTILVGDPELTGISLTPEDDAEFNFSCNQVALNLPQNWHLVPFRLPMRRNYRDLDRHVAAFIKEELEKAKDYKIDEGIKALDWVCFSLSLIDHHSKEPLLDYLNNLWIKVGREEADREVQTMFAGKKTGDSFTSNSSYLQNHFSQQLDTDYTFLIKIVTVIPHNFFAFDEFKKHFNLITERELHKKLVEVFSFRQDISLRRETVEQFFKTLNKHYSTPIPERLVRQQEHFLLREVQRTPDYPVYRLQKDFRSKLFSLAEKQLKEALIIDHLSLQENISVNQSDVISYLTLLQRPRTKDFIYFDLPATQTNGQENPLPEGIIQQACQREKTLNFGLTKLIHA